MFPLCCANFIVATCFHCVVSFVVFPLCYDLFSIVVVPISFLQLVSIVLCQLCCVGAFSIMLWLASIVLCQFHYVATCFCCVAACFLCVVTCFHFVVPISLLQLASHKSHIFSLNWTQKNYKLYNSILLVIKSNSESKKIFSYNCEFISILQFWLFLRTVW